MMLMRSLLLSTSLAALIVAAPAMAQEAPSEGKPDPSHVPLIEMAPTPDEAGEEEQELKFEGEDEGEADEAAEASSEPAPTIIMAIPAKWAPVPLDAQGRSAFGLYLAGRYALRQGESAEASNYLSQAQALTPEQPQIREQVFTASLLSGQVRRASQSVPQAEATNIFIADTGRLTLAVQGLIEGQARAANDRLTADPIDGPHLRAGIYLQPWIAGAAGDWDRALAEPPTNLDIVSSLLARANRAYLLEKRRRYEDAEAVWKDLTSHAVASRLFRLSYGEFLERRKRHDEAIVQYEAAITAGVGERRIYQALARARSKGRAPAVSDWKKGASEALIVATDQAVAQDAHQFALVYMRLALALDPTPEMTFRLGSILREAKQEIEARRVLATITPQSPAVYGAARLQMSNSYQEDGRSEEALIELEKALEVVPTDPSLGFMHANLLLQMDRLDEALAVINSPIFNTPNQGFEIRFMRGAILSEMRRHVEAEGELWAALQMQPDNAMILNHLGYLWVDQGTRVAEGAAMIARAHAADPQDGNIQDSLGWAQFRQGLFEDAVVNLEAAVAKEPANSEINDHLGDAYWMVGRHREAGFQWARVLTLEVEEDRRVSVEVKLKLEPGQALPEMPKVVAE